MAATATVTIKNETYVAKAYLKVYKIVLAGGATDFDFSSATLGIGGDTSWKEVWGIQVVPAVPIATAVYGFDGTKISGSAFTANDTIFMTVYGRF